jgi:hypothetical protein
VRQLDQHALGQAAHQVQAQHHGPVAAHAHAAAQGQQVVAGQAGEAVHLVGQKVLDAAGAGQKQMQRGHVRSVAVGAPCCSLCSTPAGMG